MIVFDMDDTLSIVGNRYNYLKRRTPNWRAYRLSCGNDKPNHDILDLYKALVVTRRVIVATSRPEMCRPATVEWFERHGCPTQNCNLLMRADGDKRHSGIIKPEMLAPYLSEITCIFDDNYAMCCLFRRMGLTCCHVGG